MKEEKNPTETPLMRQYYQLKSTYPETVLLMRVGDFYEAYGEDAVTASRVLGLVQTKRSNGAAANTAMAGFPHHAIDNYLPRLVRAGYKVAVCDQLEDPKLTKKIVKRGVTELVTPGVAYTEQLLPQKENNYLASLSFFRDKAGVAFLDISTGAFKMAEGSLDYIELLLNDFSPKEALIQKEYEEGFRKRFLSPSSNICISTMDEWAFVFESSYRKLCKHFGIESLKGFGVETMQLGITAAGAVLFYLESNRQNSSEINPTKGLSQICSLSRIDENKFVWLDKFTLRNLEIISPTSPDGVSLLQVLDKCSSPMGSRMLRTWFTMPSKELKEIKNRLECVGVFVKDELLRNDLARDIAEIGDIERIVSRAAAGRINPREVLPLRRGLQRFVPVRRKLAKVKDGDSLKKLAESMEDCGMLLALLKEKLSAEPAAQIGKGEVIARGVSAELDECRDIALHGKDILMSIQQREMERTGISSLKVSYNNVFGYYLEVRNVHKDKVPAEWVRKQTLVNAERYITPELKDYEENILGAEERIYALESAIFNEMVMDIQKFIPSIQRNATAIARADCLLCLANDAVEYGYCCPEMDDSDIIDIQQGRHPVIERMMPEGERYVANDVLLDSRKQQIIILTGPNMAGKSALLRQTALIVLMAQCGSFVPAKAARIGYVDKIFTRVGASDNISRGESTFMVEMLESSTILHNMTARSLILLDEIGRGTSTFDGMSIAWSIVEYIHEYGQGARTLFATHYHELNELESKYKRIHNYHISVKEIDGKVLFLRKLCPGGVAHSFGIHVARLAGMPPQVVSSAEKILKKLENGASVPDSEIRSLRQRKKYYRDTTEAVQLSIFQVDDPLLESIRDTLSSIDLSHMTPMDAFDTLRELKKKVGLKR
ncbi:MAG: DNA mismatch repair protein MutS [Alistipes sp.]|nr:DNA mismatch repair protein MutS [Candidatus Minthomonas equi]